MLKWGMNLMRRLLSFWRGGREVKLLLKSEQNVDECDATKV
jgi:hypothetical protein